MKHVETRLEDDTATPVSCYPGRHGDDFSGGGGFGPYGRALPTRRAGAVADAWDDWIMGNLQVWDGESTSLGWGIYKVPNKWPCKIGISGVIVTSPVTSKMIFSMWANSNDLTRSRFGHPKCDFGQIYGNLLGGSSHLVSGK